MFGSVSSGRMFICVYLQDPNLLKRCWKHDISQSPLHPEIHMEGVNFGFVVHCCAAGDHLESLLPMKQSVSCQDLVGLNSDPTYFLKNCP